MNIIEISNVDFSYSNNKILENICLKVKKNDFLSIVGPNGGGKTTLLKIITGLLKPNKGKIKILGNSPNNSKLKIGYMPQYIKLDMDFPVNVIDIVLMGRLNNKLFPFYSKKDKEIALNSIEKVKLDSFTYTPFNELSGGQKQRVLIARAITCQPELLLLDEPTSNIDPESEETLFEILKDLNKNMTIIFVSHDLGVVSKIVKSVICVNKHLVIHPTSELNGNIIKEIYGGNIKMIRHDHRCSIKGHSHD